MLTVILISLVILTHCKSDVPTVKKIPTETITIDETKTANVEFTLKKKIQLKFLAYSRVAASPYNDRIIVYGDTTDDGKKPKQVALTYDKELNLKNEKSFFYGKGPMDVGNNNIISLGKNNIYISENSNRRVAIYDNNWNFREYVTYKRGVEAFELFDNGALYIPGYEWQLDNSYLPMEVFRWDLASFPECKPKTFYQTKPFCSYKKRGDSRVAIIGKNSCHSWFFKDDFIYIVNHGQYRLLKFSKSGTMEKDVLVKVEEIKIAPSQKDVFLKEQGWHRPKGWFKLSDSVAPLAVAIPLGKGIAVVRRADYYTGCSGMANGDYFNERLEYMGKVKIPCFRNIFNIIQPRTKQTFKFAHGHLYLVRAEEEALFLEKWAVSE